MALSAEECWKSLITRYGPPLWSDSLDEDTLKLAIAERRALVTWRISDGYGGGGDLHFCRAQMGDRNLVMVFPRPCEITDEEVAVLDYGSPWEKGSDLDRFTCETLQDNCVSLALSVINLVLSSIYPMQGNRCQFLIFSFLLTHQLRRLPILAELACWRSLIIRYGSPLYKDSFDDDTLKQAIAERRALRVYGFDGDIQFCRVQVNDAIKGTDREKKPTGVPYFCIVFPQPCEITDEEADILSSNMSVWRWWKEVCKYTDWILATECWQNLVTRYGSPLEPERLDEATLEQAIAERRALKVVDRQYWDYGDRKYKSKEMHFSRAEVGNTITGTYVVVYQPYFCIVFPRPCEITDEEVRILKQVPFKRWEGICDFTNAIRRFTPDLL